ncbi:hypothetical protein EBX31_00305 [bacterium]|nr:hypothetical protein [bacterium]
MYAAETRPIILVTGCQKYREYLTPAIRRFTRPEWRTIGIMGGATTTSYDASSGILSLAVSDNYESLPTKIHAAVTWVAREFPTVPGVFKTDDDIVIGDISQLAAAICEAVAANEPYWGLFVGQCRAAGVNPIRIQHRFEDTSLRPTHQQAIYCYGHGYWLNRDAMAHVSAAEDEYRTSYLEDVCTGYVLNKKRIFPKRAVMPYQEIPRGVVLTS